MSSYNSSKQSTEKLKLANKEAHFKHTVSVVLSIYKKDEISVLSPFLKPCNYN